ncbi:transglutaminase domain-containing protein [Candidatus Woesearchaeota archaeon]|nr:transglutaminase domain-containing protein [Candidatus Woesearchaeota archaeon]
MKKEDFLKEAIDVEEQLNSEKEELRKERSALWYILAVFLALIVVSMIIPYYGVKLDPEPNYIAKIGEVLPDEIIVGNKSREIDNKRDFLKFLDSGDEVVKQVADGVVSKSGCNGHKVCYAKALFYFVKEKDNLNYINDPPDEYVKTAKETLKSGGGDCDDFSVLLANLLQAVGISTRFVFVPGHVYVEAYLTEAIGKYKSESEWVSMDSTCEYCEFGEISISSSNKKKVYV